MLHCSARLCRPDLRKASGFPPMLEPWPSSTQAGRLSLPACVEEVTQDARPSERRSLSARQAAEPQFGAGQTDGNLDKPEFSSPRRGVKPPLRQTETLLLPLLWQHAKLVTLWNPIGVAVPYGPLLRRNAVTFYLAWHSCGLHVVDVFARADAPPYCELAAAFDKADNKMTHCQAKAPRRSGEFGMV